MGCSRVLLRCLLTLGVIRCDTLWLLLFLQGGIAVFKQEQLEVGFPAKEKPFVTRVGERDAWWDGAERGCEQPLCSGCPRAAAGAARLLCPLLPPCSGLRRC